MTTCSAGSRPTRRPDGNGFRGAEDDGAWAETGGVGPSERPGRRPRNRGARGEAIPPRLHLVGKRRGRRTRIGTRRLEDAVQLPLRIERHLAVPMRDGVTLYGDLYRPRAEGKYPVLIVRTPYGVQRDGVHETMMKYAQHGYATFIQDTRGRYESEGKWEPFRTEAEDGFDTIEWAAKQPWSNGKVATQGGSYLGHVQWRAGSLGPPHLVAMFPAVASTNIYANWITLGGAFRLSFNYGWGVVRMPNRIMLPQYWHSEPYSPVELKYETILNHLPLRDGDLESAGGVVQHYRDWVAHPDYDDYWKAISDEERFSKVVCARRSRRATP